MNRIGKYFQKGSLNGSDLPDIDMSGHKVLTPENKSPRDIPADAPQFCGFCCAALEGKAFRAFTKVLPASAICCDCIKRFALMNKFTCETFDIYFQEQPDYEPLQTKILKQFFAETGSIRLKKVIAELAVRLLKRGSAILAGEEGKCSRTGIDLKPVRIALIGANAKDCFPLLKVACAETAMACLTTNRNSLSNGSAYQMLIKTLANSENQWADLGVLFCAGYAKPDAGRCSVIYACDNEACLPKDVEIIRV